jgi:hypothetical protein
MGLTGKDAVTTVFMGVIVAMYVAYLQGADLPLIASARGTTAAVLILGMVGGCALSSAVEVYAAERSRQLRIFGAVASTFGVVALVAALIGLITGSEVALAVLVCATLTLWFISTGRHACTPPSAAQRERHRHESISR